MVVVLPLTMDVCFRACNLERAVVSTPVPTKAARMVPTATWKQLLRALREKVSSSFAERVSKRGKE